MKKQIFIYCRKSSESEDRQVLSIDSQINELKKVAQRLNLEIKDILTESKSAKAPGRPVFSEMMERLYAGEAQGVLCWKLDRLARNPIDGGTIIWAIKSNGISIFTPSQNYAQDQENTLLMYVEFGMAQKFIDDLSKNTKRGMTAKAEMGWFPQNAPLGYLNTPGKRKGLRTIEADPKLFEVVKRCFKEVIEGRNAMSVYEEAVEDWGLRNPRTHKPIARSTFYKMLNNPFYFGEFYWNGKWYNGKHEAMITSEEFDMVQRMLGKRGKPVQRKQTFDLTGLFRCEQCGCAMTASRKVKYYKRTKNTGVYIYYHCTKKRKDMKCTAKPLTESDMEAAIIKQLLAATPPEEFITWAKKWLSFLHQNESNFQENVLKSNRQDLNKIDTQLNRLLDLLLNDQITEEAYKEKQSQLERDKLNLVRKVNEVDSELHHWRHKVEDALDFARTMANRFRTGDKEIKHQILLKISSDLQYENRNPLIYLKDYYEPVKKMNKGKFDSVSLARTSKYDDVFVKRPDLVPANSTWLPD